MECKHDFQRNFCLLKADLLFVNLFHAIVNLVSILLYLFQFWFQAVPKI